MRVNGILLGQKQNDSNNDLNSSLLFLETSRENEDLIIDYGTGSTNTMIYFSSYFVSPPIVLWSCQTSQNSAELQINSTYFTIKTSDQVAINWIAIGGKN